MSARHANTKTSESRKVLRASLLSSLALSLTGALILVLFGGFVLSLWMGPGFAKQAYPVLAILAAAYFALSLNIVPHNTLLAFGQVRFVSLVNIAGGVASLLAASALIPFLGLLGAALGRLLYGPITALSFWRLSTEFKRPPSAQDLMTV